jgi:hypothetical protein
MNNSLLTVVAATIVGVAGVALPAPGLAKSHKRAGYATPFPADEVRSTAGPQFIRVGPNGYWVTTTWGCWVDDGQGRIHDCD